MPEAKELAVSARQPFIDGQWSGQGGTSLAVINPATEEVLAEVVQGTGMEARRALEAAGRAMEGWKKKTAYERALPLKRLADGLRGKVEEFARTITLEQGKPLEESRFEVLLAAGTFEWYAEEGKRAYGRTIPAGFQHKRLLTLRHPVGVCAAISPWNFPLMLQARKIAPALAAGCGVVCRPASQTPLCLLQLFELIEAGGDFPPGIVNLVTGPADEIAGEFMENSICRKLSFTGSTEVGKELIRQSAAQVKNLSLELGGHAPTIVLPDADLETAARASVMGKFRNNGQVCICPTRVFVHADIYDAFVEACVEETGRLRLGNGLDPETHIGPMFEKPAMEKAADLVAEAMGKGAHCVLGGERAKGFEKGYFYQPTILTEMKDSMRMMQEESFSPVMPILKFTDLDEVLAKANATRYGLAAYVMTRDLNAAVRLAEGLEFGIIGINDTVPGTPQAPFGGLKESGLGREGGAEGLDAYLETKFVSIGLDA